RMALGIERWAILAYSTGTRVGEAYVKEYPQQVSRAVFLCPIYLRKPLKMLHRILLRVDAKRSNVINWILTDWRFFGLLLMCGFNLRRHEPIDDWMSEIKHLPPENLKRVIAELPGNGRAPFLLPTSPQVPTLFVWGVRDVLAAPPNHLRSNDAIILAGHGAPVLCPKDVAEVVLPFLKEAL